MTQALFQYIKKNKAIHALGLFIMDISLYVCNNIVSHIPIWIIRRFYLKLLGASIGKHSEINMGLYLLYPWNLKIGTSTHINQSCFFDCRDKVVIGNNVSISHYVCIVTGSHNIQSRTFEGDFKPITIEDNVFIGINATILNGVTIGEGAVICAGSVVVKDVEAYSVYGGVPAKKIGSRNRDLDYKCSWPYRFR